MDGIAKPLDDKLAPIKKSLETLSADLESIKEYTRKEPDSMGLWVTVMETESAKVLEKFSDLERRFQQLKVDATPMPCQVGT